MSEHAIQTRTGKPKLSCTVDVADLSPAPEGLSTVRLTIQSAGSAVLQATVKRKSYAKAYKTAQDSPTGAFVVVQGNIGRIEGNTIEMVDVGLVVAPKKPKAPETEENPQA